MSGTQFDSEHACDRDRSSALVYTLAGFVEHRRDFKNALRETQRMATDGALQVGDPFDTRPSTTERLAAIRWFSRCARWIRDLEIPTDISNSIHARLERLQKKCWCWTFPESPDEEPVLSSVRWALDEAGDLLNLINQHDDRSETSEIALILDGDEPQLRVRRR